MLGFKKRRRARIAGQAFPAEWLAIIEKNVPICRRLPEADRQELRRHILVFLAEKRFEGCGGLEITDEIRVTIAAQACILLLHRQTDYYPGLTSVLVYPRTYVAERAHRIVGDMVLEGEDVRLGESWHRGSVVLAWNSVRRGAANPRDGQNVVFHEFAHQLDSAYGKGDNTPVLRDRFSFAAWAQTLGEDFEEFRHSVGRDDEQVLDEYGATDEAEFFAVATECFFEKAEELRDVHAELYEALKDFYQQDPASWPAASAPGGPP
ncbi:MAG: zinc-dependent peptidase [Sedimentisphaerales bacterium]|jgi:Mlc titration factor MtfA (ptsG expression regulator)|nr:zinc-dependent peptidase [Sedimentisphaerales bacterium]HNY79434.1 zinc-dependent peptidase [Sedimentisphaerales bacterium]HOC64661.1 zinc-dependent peptidase [Sedimentisphaerales bacterium]HOH65453.1 zinc-dependent peptidase [Sedimentisphaerales bacterium]HPY51110.1 zinc-dependent peptidase [Sedimentisphaerales bacterium]